MAVVTEVPVETPEVTLTAELAVPDGARGLVIFAHGSGSSRLSPRNRMVAGQLREHRLATLLADLLTPGESAHDQETGLLRFDIELLASRTTALVDWALAAAEVRALPVGLFGASTGAAAALVAAAARTEQVRAVVSRGGRPDLAVETLPQVVAPVLLIVGERDQAVLAMNQEAAGRLGGPHRLHVVPGATHLFEEPGALPEVAERAAAWFVTHLVPSG